MRKYIFPILLAAAFLAVLIGRAYQDVVHPDAHEIETFSYLDQPDDITCGPTSATMLLKYYGKGVTLSQVEEKTRTKWFEWDGKAIGMTSPDYIAAAVRHFGVPCQAKRGSIDNLKHYVSEGRPAVVLVRSGSTTWHYVVVIGFSKETVVVADPGGGVRFVMPVEHFVGAWAFKTDMCGRACGIGCPACGGRGTYSEWFAVTCDLCNGHKTIDPVKEALWAGEIYPQTMIVPNNKKD